MTFTVFQLARQLVDELEAANIPYAVGGALALGAWGFPRATKDVDIDIFVSPDQLTPVFEVLRNVGCKFDDAVAQTSATERGDFYATYDGIRVDIFVPSIPFYDSVRQRIRLAQLRGRPAYYLSPEDLAVFKFMFFRTKDILDVERLVSFLGTEFDRNYVRQSLVDIMGADDERVVRWDRLLQDVDSNPVT